MGLWEISSYILTPFTACVSTHAKTVNRTQKRCKKYNSSKSMEYSIWDDYGS